MIVVVLAQAVHTTGVNWVSVVTVVSSITAVLVVFTAVLNRSFKRALRDQITVVVGDLVTPILNEFRADLEGHDARLNAHDAQIARLEGVEEGKKIATAMAGVTTKSPGEMK